MKADLRKVNFNKSATWNIWKQLGIDIDTLTKKLDVKTKYFPEDEQQRLIRYLIKNHTKLKFYKRKPKYIIVKQIYAEYLAYFPSRYKK